MPYKWDTPQQQAMEQLQTALTTAPVLILPDLDRDYVVEADAGDQAVGAVLIQDHGRAYTLTTIGAVDGLPGKHFHYDIIYKLGLHNKANALGRPGHVAGIQLDEMNHLLKGLFQHGYSVDVDIATVQK
ncbi:unnamed protein product [Closterium sp. NIES-53]